MVREYTLLLFFLHPSFLGRSKAALDFFVTKYTKKNRGLSRRIGVQVYGTSGLLSKRLCFVEFAGAYPGLEKTLGSW